MYPSLGESDHLESFDEIIEGGSRSPALLNLEACSMQSSMCFAMEGLMTTLFTPPGCDWADNNSLVGRETDTRGGNSGNHELAVPDQNRSRSATTLTARKVCSLWKKKRKAEKKRIMELRERQDDCEIHSEIKLSALGIQRSFEKQVPNDESDDELRRATYEKYGSRAEFIRNHRQ